MRCFLFLVVFVIQSSTASTNSVPRVDHHAHLYSPHAKIWLKEKYNIDILRTPASQLIGDMKLANIDKSIVLSVAYLYLRDEGQFPNSYKMSKIENDWVAEQVLAYPDKLIGFFSINPISDSARREIERCVSKGVFKGVKLHFANSKVDFSNELHVEKIAATFRAINALGLPILTHVGSPEFEYGKKQARIFIERILLQAPDVPVVIAHMGGWGAFNPATDEVLSVFSKFTSQFPERAKKVFFDISAVVRSSKTESFHRTTGPSWWPENKYGQLAKRIRELGIERVVFGSDYFKDRKPLSYSETLKNELPLTEKEFRILFGQRFLF